MTDTAHSSGDIVPFPGVSLAPARGWHGMIARPLRRYSPDDWKTWGDLGEARLVDSARGSPAWLVDICRGIWILSINGVGFEAFERSPAAIGTLVEIHAFAPCLGSFSRTLILVEQPAKGAAPRQKKRAPPAWTRERPVLPRKQVFKEKRARYSVFAAQHPHVRHHAWFLTLLLKMQWRRGIIPRHETIGKAAGVSTSTVKLAQACCRHFGFVRVISGKRSHRHNTYEVCWPAGSDPV